MAIKRQNRTLLIFVVSTLIVLGYMLLREGKLTPSDENAVDQDKMGDQMGDQIAAPSEKPRSLPGDMPSSKPFPQILTDMAECLDIKSPEASGDLAVRVETLIQHFQGELGPVSHQADRWISWNLKNRDGSERRLRLEVTENDEGKMGRELHYFALDQKGQTEPLELEPEQANNPSDETINQMLKEGEVLYKERAAFALFPGGERLEYVEKDGELSEIEFIRAEKSYRCHDLEARQSCQCTP